MLQSLRFIKLKKKIQIMICRGNKVRFNFITTKFYIIFNIFIIINYLFIEIMIALELDKEKKEFNKEKMRKNHKTLTAGV